LKEEDEFARRGRVCRKSKGLKEEEEFQGRGKRESLKTEFQGIG
jgi:hypothetical protein